MGSCDRGGEGLGLAAPQGGHEGQIHRGRGEEAEKPGEAVDEDEQGCRLLNQSHGPQEPWQAGYHP
jgi:hypothetical protein